MYLNLFTPYKAELIYIPCRYSKHYSNNRYKENTVNKADPFIYQKKIEDCSICQDECEEYIHKLKCGHYFHINCIETWIATGHSVTVCPVCRDVISRITPMHTNNQHTNHNPIII
jgi:E3 ubiquitin-protein ligase synoviolin